MSKISDKICKRLNEISTIRKKFFLWMAGFHNIEKADIKCKNKYDYTTWELKEDGNFDTTVDVLNLQELAKESRRKYGWFWKIMDSI